MVDYSYNYRPIADAAAARYNLPRGVFSRLIESESNFNPNAINKESGAAGIAQFMPETAKQFGIDPMKPSQALPAAAQYLSQLLTLEGGNVERAVARYKGYSDLDTGSQASDVQKVIQDVVPQVGRMPKEGETVKGRPKQWFDNIPPIRDKNTVPELIDKAEKSWLTPLVEFFSKKVLGVSIWVIGAILVIGGILAFITRGTKTFASNEIGSNVISLASKVKKK